MLKFLILLFIPSYLFASALIYKDDKKKELLLISRLHVYGVEATPEIAAEMAHEIDTMWNEPEAYYKFNGEDYRIRFVIDYKFHGKAEPALDLSCANNRMEIRRSFSSDDISGYIFKANRGYFYLKDIKDGSTTFSHEFGHGLNLDHPHGADQKQADVLGIMFARGTAVKSEFQYNPAARSGSYGSDMNPKYRKVRVQDVMDIPLKKVFIFNNYGCLGKGNPIPLPQ